MKVTNGKDVARLLVDEYLNCHPTGHKKFMESMAKEQQEIKDNYTYLGFAWLKGLNIKSMSVLKETVLCWIVPEMLYLQLKR